jgi:hypothetical protein
MFTHAYNVNAKYILHAVCPIYDANAIGNFKTELEETYNNVFNFDRVAGHEYFKQLLPNLNTIKSLAVPLLSGNFFNTKLCFDSLNNALMDLEFANNTSSLKEIIVVLKTKNAFEEIKKQWRK